jgi:hypothetical protein
MFIHALSLFNYELKVIQELVVRRGRLGDSEGIIDSR